MSDQGEVPTPTSARNDAESIGELVFQISDSASVLIREEIELAKTEVTEKVSGLFRASFLGAVAFILGILLLGMLFLTLAVLLNDLFFGEEWPGYLISTVLLGLATLVATRYTISLFRSSSPPTPDMAIEEAREIKEAFENVATGNSGSQAETPQQVP